MKRLKTNLKFTFNYRIGFLFFCLFISTTLFAEVKPSSLFCDHMVLQRDIAIPVWGTADAGEKVTVTLDNSSTTTTTNASGKWLRLTRSSSDHRRTSPT